MNGVVASADEQLAFVGAGSRGVALVDLTGVPSIQPIDLDRDGLDDRILGFVDTAGSAGRIALNLARGLGYVADGGAGLATLQLTPARVRLDTLLRDPVRGIPGDEVSILESRIAFTTDEAVRIGLSVALPIGSDLYLTISEDAGDELPLLSFGDGATSKKLASGENVADLLIARGFPTSQSRVTLRIVTTTGATVSAVDFVLVAPVVGGARLQSMVLTPGSVVLDGAQPSAQLAVLGTFSDGRVFNMTASAFGTTYLSSRPLVAQVSPDGVVTGLAGGTAEIVAFNSGLMSFTSVTVRAPAQLAALELQQAHVTLTQAGQTLRVAVGGRLTDGRLIEFGTALGLQFSSSNPSVVAVDSAGILTALGQGVATITVTSGTLTATLQVAVEFRVAANLSALEMLPFSAPAGTDTAQADASARVTGTGSLEGLSVTFRLPDAREFSALTDRDGLVTARLFNLRTAGSFVVAASVVNPASGTPLTDNETLTVETRGQDGEPNDSPATAIPITQPQPVSGQLGGADLRDAYRLDAEAAGTLVVRLSLSPETDPATVRVVFFSASGTELARLTPTSRSARFEQPTGVGPVIVAIESTGAAVEYLVATRVEQGPIAVISVTPPSGGAGTLVRIEGTGFTTDIEQTRVLFGGAVGRVESVAPTVIDVRVPSTAVDGPLTVISGAQRVQGPIFAVGRTTPLPRATNNATFSPAAVRRDPVDGQLFEVTKLSVWLDPVATRADLEALLAPLNGTIVSEIPALNQYLVELAGITTIAANDAARQQLRQSAAVRRVTRNLIRNLEQTIDSRDRAGTWPNSTVSRGIAYAQARIYEAIQAIRNTPPFTDALSLRPVKVAVIDTGFDPVLVDQFLSASGQRLVQLVRPDATTGVFAQSATYQDANGHGTNVTSIIAAVNDGIGMSGVLNSVFQEGEEPYRVQVYQNSAEPDSVDDQIVFSALSEIAQAGDVDAVNMSFGYDYKSPTQAFLDDAAAYRDAVAPLGGRTLVAMSAGNKGVLASLHTPSVVTLDLPHVLSVGAVAVANFDGTGELLDERARFGGKVGDGIPCPDDPVPQSGSNCGVGVSLAAPGEDVLLATTTQDDASGYSDPALAKGTSFATPMVTAVAALLQAIRPTGALIPPAQIAALLIESGDDITAAWGSGAMTRLNALNAVRAVLPPSASQSVYSRGSRRREHERESRPCDRRRDRSPHGSPQAPCGRQGDLTQRLARWDDLHVQEPDVDGGVAGRRTHVRGGQEHRLIAG